MCSEVDLGILESQLGADVVPVEQNRILGKKQQLSDLLVGLSLFDQVGYPDLHGSKIEKL